MNYSFEDLLSLSGWSKHKIKPRFESSLAFTSRRGHRTYAQVLADKSDRGHKVAHGNNCVYHKAPVIDLVAPIPKVVNTDFSTNEVKGSTDSKHKVLQFQVDRIETQTIGVSARNNLCSDPILR